MQHLQSKKMGEGEAVASELKVANWSYVARDSAYDLIFAQACKVPKSVWVTVNTDNETFVSAIDTNSIVKNGQFVQMRGISDHEKLMNVSDCKPYFSAKSLKEYDCKTKRSRTLSSSYHADHMGRGKVSCAETKPDDWSAGFGLDVESKVVADACKKK